MSGVCDTNVPTTWRDTPNFRPRRDGLTPTILLMHYTGMESAQDALDLLCHEDSGVSCHYLVDEQGQVTQMVAENERAWHAGKSYWAGEHDINSASIGIEIVNEGHGADYKDFPDRQIEAVIELSKDILARHNISAHNVIGHSDVAPERKKDPGEKFPWQKLHENGVGLWVEPEPIGDDFGFGMDEEGREIFGAQKLLARYGYQIEANGRFDQQTMHVLTAFQRHFRPAQIGGRLDRSTIKTLARLIQECPPKNQNGSAGKWLPFFKK